jgi:hypothetical protein
MAAFAAVPMGAQAGWRRARVEAVRPGAAWCGLVRGLMGLNCARSEKAGYSSRLLWRQWNTIWMGI